MIDNQLRVLKDSFLERLKLNSKNNQKWLYKSIESISPPTITATGFATGLVILASIYQYNFMVFYSYNFRETKFKLCKTDFDFFATITS